MIEGLSKRYSVRVMVGDVYKDKDRVFGRVAGSKMRHGIHRWSASKLARILDQMPTYIGTVPEWDTSGKNPFDQSELSHTSAVIPVARVIG